MRPATVLGFCPPHSYLSEGIALSGTIARPLALPRICLLPSLPLPLRAAQPLSHRHDATRPRLARPSENSVWAKFAESTFYVLPRRATGGLFQGLQGLRTIHASAPYEVDRRGVDLVDERVDAQVTRQVLVLLQERAGLAGGLQRQPARLVGRISGGLQVGGQGDGGPGQAANRCGQTFGDGIFGFGLDHGERRAG